jgi:diguanylate cyclase (GGDEF)-like protein/putative nucleotidyltransferase with HDIG domain
MIVIAACAELVLIAFLLALMFRRHRRLRQAEIDALRVAARTDSLTGLGNHRSFHDDLIVAMRARTQRGATFALMAVDLDGLKRINDTDGHQAGDEYLCEASRFLKQAVGAEGTVYRIGGDEFMALLPDRGSWRAFAVARTLDQLTRSAFGRRAVSIGITESTGTESRQRLIQQADIALYDAKRGDATIVVFHPSSTRNARLATATPTHQATLVAALVRAVDAKDVGTSSHSGTVASLVVAIGDRLGLRGERLECLRRAGLLHDVGKIGIADRILKKPTSLHAEEQQEMRAHVTIGHTILNANDMPLEARWVLHHHERWDGAGYPDGLRGSEIPIESRILAVADAFEAMTGIRPYQDDMPVADALAELERHAGAQFDRRCVEALCEVMRREQAEAAPTVSVAR